MRRIHRQLCLLASLVLVVHAVPIAQPVDEDEIAKKYLNSFYSRQNSKEPENLPGKLKQMQKFFGLKVTGTLNRETLNVMKKPRCGVPDIAAYSTFEDSPKWQNNMLTYRIENYTPDMSVAEVDDSIKRALQVWADVTPLRFTRIYNGTADVMISFAIKDHGDGYSFEGQKNVLAHAFAPSPGIGGDAHFNDDQVFTLRSRDFVLFLVAAHEFGHSLGLFHSNVRGALMHPTYSFTDPNRFSLHSDDITGIQSLYPTVQMTPNACDPNLILDAVTTLRGETIFFKDSFFWRGSSSTHESPLLIGSFWPGAPDNIDAAYEDPVRDIVFFFKGTQVWAFKGSDLESDYPRTLGSFGLLPSVTKVSAAVHNRNSGKTLLFFDRYYYSYDERVQRMDRRYPRRLEDGFPPVTGEVTAAHLFNDNIYLFSGTNVYEFSSSRRFLRVLNNNYFLSCEPTYINFPEMNGA